MTSSSSIDVELVALGIGHGDGVVVKSFAENGMDYGRTQLSEPSGFSVDPLLADFEGNRAAAADAYIHRSRAKPF